LQDCFLFPPLPRPLRPLLRVNHRIPGRSGASLGGDASRRWQRRGSGACSLGFSSSCCREIAQVASRSRLPGPIGRTWCARLFFVLAALLRWQEGWFGRRLKGGSSNKAVLPSFWRLHISALLRSARCSSELFVVMSSRWRCDAGRSGGAFFNKCELIFLWIWCLLLLLPLPTGHGGCGDEELAAVCYSKGGDGGRN
jgi:hypothetical protein